MAKVKYSVKQGTPLRSAINGKTSIPKIRGLGGRPLKAGKIKR